MLSLEPELTSLRDRDLLDAEPAARLLAIERREVVSLHTDLRVALWIAVALIASGVGLFLKENVDRIGHATLIALIALAASVCYGIVWRRRARGSASSALDYLLLLGALLLTTDVGYAEAQFRFFGEGWRHHLLILAAVHGTTAYLYDSRLLLSLAITSLAGWFGVDNRGEFLGGDPAVVASRLLGAAGATLLWRLFHTRLAARRHFEEIFDHGIAHFALLGAVSLSFDARGEWLGLLLLATVVWSVVTWGIRTRSEAFVVYGFLYGIVGLDAAIWRHSDEALALGWTLLTTPVAIAALFVIHRRWRREW